MTKYLSLKENEELIIGIDQKPKVVRIKNKNNKLQISEITPEEITDNIVITELNFDELKIFVLYESYYQVVSNLDIDKETMKKIMIFVNIITKKFMVIIIMKIY